MNRQEQLDKLQQEKQFDIVIIGGGATGLGCAVDAALRGYKTLLLERDDFSKGTSSRSTKLVHGGVRYLAQGNIHLVREALAERGRLLRNAPHVCHSLGFVVPAYAWWQKWYFGFGLWLYEGLSGRLSLGKTRLLSKKHALQYLPGLSTHKLSGAVLYYDGQFDDSRLAVNLAQTATEHGAVVLNYFEVTRFVKQENKICGLVATNRIDGSETEINARVVVNATGVFADALLQLAEGHSEQTIAPSQGIHLVVDQLTPEGQTAMMIPKTDDGRVLFAIPWHGKLLLGTTDTPVASISSNPVPLQEEIDYIIRHYNRYTRANISYGDVKSVFAGLRPLAFTGKGNNTAELPRDHVIKVMPSGLVHVTGGKWTTNRSMAEKTIDLALQGAGLPYRPAVTKDMKIHGWSWETTGSHLDIYGSDAVFIREIMESDSSMAERIHPLYPYTVAEVRWFAEHEMALTVEDVLARRLRLLFLDAGAAIEAAPLVARIIASCHAHSTGWVKEQVAAFEEVGKGFGGVKS